MADRHGTFADMKVAYLRELLRRNNLSQSDLESLEPTAIPKNVPWDDIVAFVKTTNVSGSSESVIVADNTTSGLNGIGFEVDVSTWSGIGSDAGSCTPALENVLGIETTSNSSNFLIVYVTGDQQASDIVLTLDDTEYDIANAAQVSFTPADDPLISFTRIIWAIDAEWEVASEHIASVTGIV